jgi:probable F420-dependent oxidoreductase
MKFGIMLGVSVGDGFAYREFATETVIKAEQIGFESVWCGEHVVVPEYDPRYPYTPDGKLPQPPQTDFPDPLVWLAHVGALTSTIRLGTAVLILPQRNPVILAKEIATVDLLSNGRVEIGVGVGWMREESEAVGAPFAARGRRTDEFIEALRALWTADRSSYAGEHVTFTNVCSYPKPVQPTVPILVGGSSAIAARRAGRLGDGFFPVAATTEHLSQLIAAMHAAAAEADRDPSTIEITNAAFALTSDDPITPTLLDDLRRMEELGVQRIIVPRLLDTPLPKALDSLDRLAGELISAY